MPQFNWFSCLVLTGLFLMGCGLSQEKDASSTPGRPPFDEKSVGDCPTNPNGGLNRLDPAALLPLSASGYFDKTWQGEVFIQALQSSSVPVVDYLFSRGVQVLKVSEESQATCRYFGFLSPAGPLLEEIWQSQGGNPGGPSSALLGLFRSQFRRGPQGTTEMINPTILLREDTTRWTLLHEQGHFLYSWARSQQRDMPFIEDLRETNRRLFQEIQNVEVEYTLEPSNSTANKLVATFANYWQVNRELFSRGPLEEFAIEAKMIERALQGQILDLHDSEAHLIQGFDYMRLNGEPVIRSLQTLLRKTEDYSELLSEEDLKTLQKLRQVQLSLQKDLVFAQDKLQEVQKALRERGLKPQRNLDRLQSHPHYEFELFLEQLKNIEAL